VTANLVEVSSAMTSSSAYNLLLLENADGVRTHWSGTGRLYLDAGGLEVTAGMS
jgi:hypothetical protein